MDFWVTVLFWSDIQFVYKFRNILFNFVLQKSKKEEKPFTVVLHYAWCNEIKLMIIAP